VLQSCGAGALRLRQSRWSSTIAVKFLPLICASSHGVHPLSRVIAVKFAPNSARRTRIAQRPRYAAECTGAPEPGAAERGAFCRKRAHRKGGWGRRNSHIRFFAGRTWGLSVYP
jgi:hypothetical protein